MAQKVTIRDIAEKSGTSVTSVHRALYGGKGISESLRQKILTEVERSHYQMDEAASMLRRGQFRIAVLLPRAAGQERFYYRGLWDGIYHGAEELRKNKVQVDYLETSNGPSHMAESLEKLYDNTDESLNGLVTVCDDRSSGEWLLRFIRRGTRVALVDRGIEMEQLNCRMETSTQDMGRLAVNMMEFLLTPDTKGRVILVNGPETRISYQVYARVVQERLKESRPGLQLTVLNGYDVEGGRKELEKILKSEPICGIIAGCARGTYWVCKLMNRLRPNPMPHVIGTDVFEELAPFFENGILEATIYQSHRENAEEALKMLYEQLSNPHSANQRQKKLVTLSLVLRENFKYYL